MFYVVVAGGCYPWSHTCLTSTCWLCCPCCCLHHSVLCSLGVTASFCVNFYLPHCPVPMLPFYNCFRSRAVSNLRSEVQSSTIRGGALLSQYVNNECSVEQRQKLCAFTRIWLLLLSECLGGYDVLLSVFRPWFCFLIRPPQPTEIWKTKGSSARKLQLQPKNASSAKLVQIRLQCTCAPGTWKRVVGIVGSMLACIPRHTNPDGFRHCNFLNVAS